MEHVFIFFSAKEVIYHFNLNKLFARYGMYVQLDLTKPCQRSCSNTTLCSHYVQGLMSTDSEQTLVPGDLIFVFFQDSLYSIVFQPCFHSFLEGGCTNLLHYLKYHVV